MRRLALVLLAGFWILQIGALAVLAMLAYLTFLVYLVCRLPFSHGHAFPAGCRVYILSERI